MIRKITWTLSFCITLILLVAIYLVINSASRIYLPEAKQFLNQQQVNRYLKESWLKTKKPGEIKPSHIPTGIFIESLQFVDANTVLMSGYVWQRYDKKLLASIQPGVVFPEGVGVTLTESYRHVDGSKTVIGWYFEGKFIQNFNYIKYPIDHKRVWLRIWAKQFDKSILLTPDLPSYVSTNPLQMHSKLRYRLIQHIGEID